MFFLQGAFLPKIVDTLIVTKYKIPGNYRSKNNCRLSVLNLFICTICICTILVIPAHHKIFFFTLCIDRYYYFCNDFCYSMWHRFFKPLISWWLRSKKWSMFARWHEPHTITVVCWKRVLLLQLLKYSFCASLSLSLFLSTYVASEQIWLRERQF